MYCTQQDLTERFGIAELEAKAWDTDLDKIDDARVLQACSDATDEANLYLAGVLSFPVETVPPVLVRLASDLARYHLQSRNPLDEVKARYDAAIRTMKDIGTGRATLGIPDVPTTPAHVEGLRNDSDRLFTRETLADF